jgi:hypothetical protein
MCQAKSRGQRGDHHHHHGRPDRPGPPAQHAAKPDRPTRREVLGGLKTAGLVAAASGLPRGTLVRAFADDGHPPAVGLAPGRLFDLEKVADGIFAAIAKPTAMLNCDAAVVVKPRPRPGRWHPLETLAANALI